MRDKVMNVKLKRSFIQATKTEPAREVISWLCEVAPGTPCPYVQVKTLDEARKLATQEGFDGILL